MKRLSRAATSLPAPPVRMVHLGVGAFHRAHQAWYAAAAGGWGIAAVAPRSAAIVEELGAQDGLYSLVTRSPDGDTAEVVPSISQVLSGADPGWVDLVSRAEVAVVTVTITEAGYRADSPLLAALVAGIDRRRATGGGGLALVSCDNLAGNGEVLRSLIRSLATRAGQDVADFVDERCAFPSTVVDRITPATDPADLRRAGELVGFEDRAAVVTEPFTEWVLEDRFPAGRPAWERGGAVFVADTAPYERRKLRLLNAGHSLLSYEGTARGHRYVHEAVADPVVHERLVAFWAEATAYLEPVVGMSSADYLATVERRWSNARLPHSLAQIGVDGSLKLRQRVVPTILAARRDGVVPEAALGLLGAWVAALRAEPPVHDRGPGLAAAITLPLPGSVRAVLTLLDVRLGDDPAVCAAVADAVAERQERRPPGPPVSR